MNAEEQDINTFTKWANSHLKETDYVNKDGEHSVDFNDGDCFENGLALIHLYQKISGYQFPKYNKNPKIEIQKVENLQLVLSQIQLFLDELKIKVQYGAQQIHQGDKKQLLGLTFVLISRFVIADGESESMKEMKAELLQWCRDNTENYDNVDIQDFTHSFCDGLAFNALIHNFFGDEEVEYSKLDAQNRLENLKLATSTAEGLGIDNLIDEATLASGKDISERSVITYVALYKQLFKGMADDRVQQKLNRSVKSFQFSAGGLVDSLQKQIDTFNNADVSEATNNEATEAQAALAKYKETERSVFSKQGAALQIEWYQLQAERAKYDADPYVPGDDDVALAQVSEKISELREAEAGYMKRIMERIFSFNEAVATFDASCAKYTEWAEAELGKESPDAESSQKQFDALSAEYQALQNDNLSVRSSIDFTQVSLLNQVVAYQAGADLSEDLQEAWQLADSAKEGVDFSEQETQDEEPVEQQETQDEEPVEQQES